MSHNDLIIDNDGHFIIDPITRQITNTSGKTTLMQYDHNSERITFEVEPVLEGHNMAQCNRVEIHYINISTDKRSFHEDLYEVDDLKIDEDKLTFSWLIRRNATQLAGVLSFAIRFICVENGEEVYSWGTSVCDVLKVSESINNSDVINTEEYTDIINQWYSMLVESGTEGVNKVEEAKNNALAELDEKKAEMLEDIDVVQTTGDSESAVMSQKAVTQLFSTTVKKTSVNKYNGEKVLGFVLSTTVKSSETYYRTAPIYLTEGSYLYNASSSLGSNGIYVGKMSEYDEYISTIRATKIDDDKFIFKVEISEKGYYSFNVGSATYSKSFMVVSGESTEDFPSEYIEYSVTLEDNINFNQTMLNVLNKLLTPDNMLYGKQIIFDGDSICNASSAQDDKSGYAGRIGNKNNMNWSNKAIGGATITGGLTYSNGSNRHWVSSNIDTIYSQYPNLDYLILEGGTNDADLLGENGLGNISTTSVNYNDFDNVADFTQALEYLFSKAIAFYPTAKIGFIIPHKMGTSPANYRTHNRRLYFDRCIEVCEKYGIPYLDLWYGCHLNPTLDYATHDNTYYMYADSQHLSSVGYDYISNIIEAWIKTL